MANRKTNSVNAWEDTVASSMDSTTLTLLVNDASALVVPCYLVIEPENNSQREYVYVESKLANTLTIASGERYLAGSSAGSGLSHSAGVIVRHASVAQHHTDLNDRIDAHAHGGGTDGAQVDHGGLGGLGDDDHTQYLTTARHSALSGDHVTGGDSHTHLEADVTDLTHTTDHGALAGLADDDHTQYLDTTRHAAVDHGALVSGADFGDIKMTGRTTAPSGWLLCQGQAINRTTYADLFAAIGTAYGVGDGSTTFNIPDMRQRFAMGKADAGTGAALGDTGGLIDHTHSGPSHSHSFSDTTSSDSHSHGGSTSGGSSETAAAGANETVAQNSHQHTISTDSDNHSHTVSGTTGTGGTGATGTGNPPFVTVNYIIYTGV